MNRRFLRNLQLSLATLDMLALNAVFFSSQFLFRKQIFADTYPAYSIFGFFLSVAWLVVSLSANIYSEKYILSFEVFLKRSAYGWVYFQTVVIFYLFFLHQYQISRLFIITVLTSIPIMLLFNRFLYIVIFNYLKSKNFFISKVVIIGYNRQSKKLAAYLRDEGVNKEIIGYCEEEENVGELSNYPILSSIGDALRVCKENGVTEIFSTIAPEHNPHIYELIDMADKNCIRFRIVPDVSFFINRQVHVDYIKEMPVLSLRQEPLEDLDSRIRKRLFDLVVSAGVTVFILSWLVPLIGLLIWLESKGPVFFIQARSGKDNVSFPCLKFRSMRMNTDANNRQASKHDARITKIGRFLRRTSLDEFPQFLNVLIGHMSVVGPRPHMLKHTDDYARLIEQYMVRQFLKPGITGWAQVNGFRGETKTVDQMHQRVVYDIWYMENWNLWLDLKIIFMTVYNTLKGEENAF